MDQAVLLEFGQGAELPGDGLLAGAVRGQAQVDDVEGVHAEVREVLPDLGRQVGGLQRGTPAAVRTTAGADLGHDAQVGRVRVERLPDQLVDHHRPVEVAGVDVGNAGFDGFAQDREGLVAIPGRAEDPGPGQLHGAEAHAADDEVVGELEGTAGNLAVVV